MNNLLCMPKSVGITFFNCVARGGTFLVAAAVLSCVILFCFPAALPAAAGNGPLAAAFCVNVMCCL